MLQQKYKQKERINTYIDPIIAKRTKAQALVEEKSVSEIIENALKNYLPSVVKIEFKMIKKPKVGRGLSIRYDYKELDFLAEKALKESKRGETIVIDSLEKLQASIKEMGEEAK